MIHSEVSSVYRHSELQFHVHQAVFDITGEMATLICRAINRLKYIIVRILHGLSERTLLVFFVGLNEALMLTETFQQLDE